MFVRSRTLLLLALRHARRPSCVLCLPRHQRVSSARVRVRVRARVLASAQSVPVGWLVDFAAFSRNSAELPRAHIRA